MVVLAEGGIMLVTTAAAGEFALAATTGVALGGLGTLLNEAADANCGSSAAQPPHEGPAPGTKPNGRVGGVDLDPAVRAKVMAKLPSEWGEGTANGKGVGTRWFDPADGKGGSGVRVDQGNPDAKLLSQRVDHVVVRRRGQVIGPDGQKLPGALNSFRKDTSRQRTG